MSTHRRIPIGLLQVEGTELGIVDGVRLTESAEEEED
jgi:hypothetical protein